MFDRFLNKNQTNPEQNQLSKKSSSRRFLPIIIIIIILVLVAIAVAVKFYLDKKYQPAPIIQDPDLGIIDDEIAPEYSGLLPAEYIMANRPLLATDEEVEYLVFQDFYYPFAEIENVFLHQYQLPINIKTDTLNYYDLARKINLDPIIDELNQQGFAIINNPWKSEAGDFYSAHQVLEAREIPLLISSDFILYYYNLNLKKAYQDIESSFFYDSLWNISLNLFNIARHKYESRLAEIGNINDPILEAERLSAAYFAVALELLKPQANQIESSRNPNDKKFSLTDVQTFYFSLPNYLTADVNRELELIREASRNAKSPVLFYNRDYRELAVPLVYRQNARQTNFYLASRWFSSLFPLNYRQDSCPDCLLDKYDWRINLTAATLISQDIASDIWLKAEWARIYKLIYFFQGLRDNLTYLYYQNDFYNLFGETPVAEVFGSDNPEADNNLEKFRLALLEHQFDGLQGGLDHQSADNQAKIGFRLLTEPYWPLDYISKQLTYPQVSLYLNGSPAANNVTACRLNQAWQRCLSFSGDSLSLIGLGESSNYWQENIAYQNYSSTINALSGETNRALSQRHNIYWALLGSLNRYLTNFNPAVTSFGQTTNWQTKSLDTARAALVDCQLPMDQFSYRESSIIDGSLSMTTTDVSEHIYLDPSINLINDLLANVKMLSNMLIALGVENKSGFILSRLDSVASNLVVLSNLATKTASQQEFTEDDRLMLSNFMKLYKIDKLENKRIINDGHYRGSLLQDLSQLKFLVLLYPTNNKPIIVLSPIFYLEEKQP